MDVTQPLLSATGMMKLMRDSRNKNKHTQVCAELPDVIMEAQQPQTATHVHGHHPTKFMISTLCETITKYLHLQVKEMDVRVTTSVFAGIHANYDGDDEDERSQEALPYLWVSQGRKTKVLRNLEDIFYSII